MNCWQRIERILFFLSFCLKVNGDLRTISKNGTPLRTYYYDQAGQLTQEINHEAGIVSVYHYDAGGNLSYRNRGPYDPDHITELWKDKTYTYGDANWKDKLTAYNGKPITYDEIGNPLTYDGWTYTWEAGRQLKKQVKGNISIEYVYDENGLRTQKKTTENDKTTVYDYVWKGDRLIGLTIDAGISIEYLYFFYDEDGKAAGFVHDNKDVYFYQTDAQGNVNAIVKQDGTTAAQYTYDAWGNLLSSKGEMAKINPLTYRGYQYDQETGLYYLQSRYYNPEWGRFINADSTVDNKKVLGMNLMAYCGNNPVNKIDFNGLTPIDGLSRTVQKIMVGWVAISIILASNKVKVDGVYSDVSWAYSIDNCGIIYVDIHLFNNTTERSAYARMIIGFKDSWNKYFLKRKSGNNEFFTTILNGFSTQVDTLTPSLEDWGYNDSVKDSQMGILAVALVDAAIYSIGSIEYWGFKSRNKKFQKSQYTIMSYLYPVRYFNPKTGSGYLTLVGHWVYL